MSKGISLPKWGERQLNEDAFFAGETCVAVSDGAGGCGLFADKWSHYLIEHLPKNKSFTAFADFDAWIDGIWEAFYNEYETIAKGGDGMLLNKFYSEGSFATMAAAWRTAPNECQWIAYGDSVVFHYNRDTGCLEHSFTQLSDFSHSPYLISCKDPLEESAFKCGTFHLTSGSVVFVASDALSHYIIMCYELSKCGEFADDLCCERESGSFNAQLLLTAETMTHHFAEDVIMPLQRAVTSSTNFETWLRSLHTQGLLDVDDYTLAVLKFDIEGVDEL